MILLESIEVSCIAGGLGGTCTCFKHDGFPTEPVSSDDSTHAWGQFYEIVQNTSGKSLSGGCAKWCCNGPIWSAKLVKGWTLQYHDDYPSARGNC